MMSHNKISVLKERANWKFDERIWSGSGPWWRLNINAYTSQPLCNYLIQKQTLCIRNWIQRGLYSHYRIPGIIKLSNRRIILNAKYYSLFLILSTRAIFSFWIVRKIRVYAVNWILWNIHLHKFILG